MITTSIHKIAALLISLVLLASCSKTNTDPSKGNNSRASVPDNLHIAFATPDWQKQIDCTHLDMPPYAVSEDLLAISGTSASTLVTFYFVYPRKSADVALATNIKKYGVSDVAAIESPFQIAMKLPLDDDKLDAAHGRLVSNAGNSADEYTEITGIEKTGTEGDFDVYNIKGKYAFTGRVLPENGVSKKVTGTFHFKIKAAK